MKNRLIFISLLPVVFFAGCFKRCNVQTSTFADYAKIPVGFQSRSSFTILPMKKDNPLLEKEIEQKIETLLYENGYFVRDKNDSDYYLLFDHDMKSEKQIVSSLKYLPGETKTKSGNVYGSGHATAHGTSGWAQGNYFGSSHYSQLEQAWGSFVYVPEEITVYTGSLQLYVYDAQKYRRFFGREEELIWQGAASSSGNNGDFRDLVDYLLVSVFTRFGANTGRMVSEDVWSFDSKIKKLKINVRKEAPAVIYHGMVKRALELDDSKK